MTFDQLIEVLNRPVRPTVCTDSRSVQPGDVFVAIKGASQDGHRFIDQAVSRGARYVVCQQPPDHLNSSAEFIVVADTAEAGALLAQAIYGMPSNRLTNIAVTGTNGKTTVAYLVRSCLEKAGLRCGLISTIVYDTTAYVRQADLTTPAAMSIAQMQAEMIEAGCTYMVMEASSHALVQGRCKGIRFKAAAFTNLTSDHLDYHGTVQQYLRAKAILFQDLDGDATAVLNADCPNAIHMARVTKAPCIWYGIGRALDIRADVKSMDASGTSYRLSCRGKTMNVRSPLLGRHNVSNHLAATGICLALGLEVEAIKLGLEQLASIPGRLERIPWPGPFSVVVDFAHTEDALRNVLSTLRPLCKGRLIVIFGCGGDRDRSKRPRMAAAVQELADLAVVTSDNPRTEDPGQIIQQILAGLSSTGPDRVHVEPDRRQAIGWAIGKAREGDIVLIAGKGHEQYQILGTERHPFSDQQVAMEYLRARQT